LDRSAGAGKPIDPATRLSELLAQSLDELTRPFDPPPAKPGPAPVPLRPEHLRAAPPPAAETADGTPEDSRIDADKALAELEAELFAAAQQVSRDLPDAPEAANEDLEHHHDHDHEEHEEADEPAEHLDEPDDDLLEEHIEDETHVEPPAAARVADQRITEDADRDEADEPAATVAAAPPVAASPFLTPEPADVHPRPDADAAAVIARVRRLMLVSMAVTLVAVGTVFAFIGYRVFKGDGITAKTADKLPEAPSIPADITLSLPSGARVIQSAVAGDRLVITLEIDGKIEVRTFDVNTLQPAGRLNFSSTP
jgi:hypothetical protein